MNTTAIKTETKPDVEAIAKILIVSIGNHSFGVPIDTIQDVIKCSPTTPVPLADDNIIGLLNLRGHIVTKINVAKTLGIEHESMKPIDGCYSVVISMNNEMYSLVFEDIDEVIDIDFSALAALLFTINKKWSGLSHGVHRLDDRLLVIINIESLLEHLKHNH